MSAVSSVCKALAGIGTPSLSHKESRSSACVRMEKDVQSVLSTLRLWQDPLPDSDKLCNIASGLVATQEVERDCLRALNLEKLR